MNKSMSNDITCYKNMAVGDAVVLKSDANFRMTIGRLKTSDSGKVYAVVHYTNGGALLSDTLPADTLTPLPK